MKNFFLNLDRVTRAILVVACSLSIVMLSASCLMFSANRVFAQSPAQMKVEPSVIGLGCDETFVYYFMDSRFFKLAKKEAKDVSKRRK